jgi:hypothetical protein
MPIHIAPRIRAREEALEAAGLLVTLDSVGVTIQKNAEAAGIFPKDVPKGGITYKYNGNNYVAK